MSDSDNDLMPNNVISFQNENMTFCARGPNINTTNANSFRNNIMTSTMHMSRNFERQRYMEPSYDQRNMYYRRDTSPPMSLHNGSDFRPRNYQNMYYPRGMSSQRSMINGRGGSPMSVRSIDSNATVSATDIAMAFKNTNFNKYDLRVIKEAYNKFMKRRIRKKIEKRRKLRLFMNGQRHKSGYDSGELASDSSVSSGDCRSTSTAVYEENMSSCRSTKTDLTDFRRTIKESNLYKDCTDNFRQNSSKNMFSIALGNTSMQPRINTQNAPLVSQRDRFKTGYLLPSQRFNQSIASVSIPEKQSTLHKDYILHHQPIPNMNKNPQKAHRNEIDSDSEEIFSETKHKEKNINQTKSQSTMSVERKRSLDIDDHRFHANKKSKLSSPKKNEVPLQKKTLNTPPKDKKKTNEFEFVKPQFPVRKSSNVKEKLLAKSAPPIDIAMPLPAPAVTQEKSLHPDHIASKDSNQTCSNEQLHVTEQSTSERPSFIKRKLYTQKLDLMESKNLSGDNLGANSPQTNIYSAIQKEKNKTRKLVANQSCLSRDVQQEDNNLLDLIHKIVPPDRMNVTNKSEVVNNNHDSKNIPAEDEKWDVTSVISKCNLDDVSDTYTDEEIFNEDEKKTKSKKTIVPNEKTTECKVIVKKLILNKEMQKNLPNISIAKQDTKKANVYKCVKSFWDTDFESDLETGSENCKSNQKENKYPGNISRNNTSNQLKNNPDKNNSKISNTKVKSALKPNNIMDQVKKLNMSLSLMKKPKADEKRLESSQLKETKKCNVEKDRELISGKVSHTHTKIVLDSHNSNNTLSDVTQDETTKSANKNTRATRITKTKSADHIKNEKHINLNNSKLIPDTKTELLATSNKNKNTKTQTKKTHANKGNTSTSISKRASPRIAKETIEKSSKSNATRTTRSNTNGLDDSKPSVDEKVKPTTSKIKNTKPQVSKVKVNDSISKRKSPRTPKEFKCCSNASQPKDKKNSKTSNRSTPLKTKKTMSSMKMFLDNNNSSFSDGTPTRALRSMKSKVVVTPGTRRRVAGK